MNDLEDCPIRRTHRRLGDVYAAWHDALRAYPHPEEFRRALNSLLQETRNVTFMLQAEKHKVPDFDAWYAKWRHRMAGVSVMKWALAMRNHVVKRGDLEASSIAKVSILAQWDSPPPTNLDVPPWLHPVAIAQRVRPKGLPRQLVDSAVVIVERRWIVKTLPDREVLDALAECYEVLQELVVEAHLQCGVSIAEEKLEAVRPTWGSGPRRHGRPIEMEISQEVRTARLRLATGDLITVLAEQDDPSHATLEAAGSRWKEYGSDAPPLESLPSTADELFSLAEWHIEAGKRLLVADGYHVQLVWTYGPNGVRQDHFSPQDRTDKFIIWNRLAEQVQRYGIWGVISVGEVWQYAGPLKDIDPGAKGVEDIPGRTEALMVAAAHRDGLVRTYVAPFQRDTEGRIAFATTQLGEGSRSNPQFLYPILKVWQGWRRAESGDVNEPLIVDSTGT